MGESRNPSTSRVEAENSILLGRAEIIEGLRTWTLDGSWNKRAIATIDHLLTRYQGRVLHQACPVVNACAQCNHARNGAESKGRRIIRFEVNIGMTFQPALILPTGV